MPRCCRGRAFWCLIRSTRRRSKSCWFMPRRSTARSCRSTMKPAPCWGAWPTAMAAPQALVTANAAKDALDFLGHPEGELAIAQAVIYLATAPKSNAAYKAFGAAMRAAREGGSLLPPKHILNSPTRLMKSEGYGSGYEYDHDTAEAFSGQDYFPDALGRQTFYDPPDRGFEREIRKRMDYWAKLRRERAQG